MKLTKNNKGFTLVELLAVIVVLAIVMSMAVVAITGVLDNARKSSFVADAKSFLDGARNLVTADDVNTMLGTGTSNYAPRCANGKGETKYIPLNVINLQSGGKKSPYGNDYKKGTSTTMSAQPTGDVYSYIQVTSTYQASNPTNSCPTTYSIFLYDGVYAIGTAAAPIPFDDVGTDDVKVYTP